MAGRHRLARLGRRRRSGRGPDRRRVRLQAYCRAADPRDRGRRQEGQEEAQGASAGKGETPLPSPLRLDPVTRYLETGARPEPLSIAHFRSLTFIARFRFGSQKQANGQVAHEGDAKSKKATDSKKSPAKSKEQDKKSKEKAAEPKSAPAKQAEKKSPPPPKKEAVKKQKERAVKPADYDEGEWEKVPSRSDKKKKNQEENKKESPTKKKGKDGKKETFVEEKKADRPEPPPIPKDLQEKVNELQRVLNEVRPIFLNVSIRYFHIINVSIPVCRSRDATDLKLQ